MPPRRESVLVRRESVTPRRLSRRISTVTPSLRPEGAAAATQAASGSGARGRSIARRSSEVSSEEAARWAFSAALAGESDVSGVKGA